MKKKFTFEVNTYDEKGLTVEEGIYLHYGDPLGYTEWMFRINSTKELKKLIKNLKQIHKEIKENYDI